eukprot:gene10668-10827_t
MEEEQLFNQAMSIISAWSDQQRHRPHMLQKALWERFGEAYGMNLAAALALGPTSRAHTVTEEDRKTMLTLFVETLGRQFHINMLVPLVQALQFINESQTTARHVQVEAKQLQRHQRQHAAAAAPSGKSKRRSNATGSPAAAAAVDPKQQKLPGMVDKWRREVIIAYEPGRTRQPQDVQKLFNTVTRLDREQQQEAEQQLNLELNPADSDDSMQHNQPADVCDLDQPEANLPLMASGATAFRSARSKECRGAQGALSASRQQQQQPTPGPLHHIPVCFGPPAQPLVDYASESRGNSDGDPGLLPTQPVDAAGAAGGGLGERPAPGGQNLQAAMAAGPGTLQQHQLLLHNRSPGNGRGQRSKVATTALAKEVAAASAIHIDSSDDGGS